MIQTMSQETHERLRDARPDGKGLPRVSVIMPIYNEHGTIEDAINEVNRLRERFDLEIVPVDDGSTDGGRDILHRYTSRPGYRVCFHDRNRGKGAALRTGFLAATGDIVVVMDADLEYAPEDIPPLLVPILTGRADVVFGSRFLGGPHRVLYFWHSVGNKLLTLLSNMLSNLNLTDMEVCLKAFRREVLESIDLTSNRFGFEVEITAKVAKGGWRVYELPVSYRGRTYAEGKKITWRDGLAAVWHILRFNLFTRRLPARSREHQAAPTR